MLLYFTTRLIEALSIMHWAILTSSMSAASSALKPVPQNISVSGAAALGRYHYSSRQHATITLDNTAETVDDQTVYSENFRVAGTPQNAYSIKAFRTGRLNFGS